MAYGLWLVLDQDKWYRNDFSSENKLTGTIYSNKQLTVKKDLTGYTITIRMHLGHRLGDRFGKEATIVSASDGTWEYAVGRAEMPPPNIYRVKAELTKSGVQESTINPVEILVVEGPAA